MKPLIRQAVPGDAHEIEDVLFDVWFATYPNDDVGVTREDIEEKFENRHDREVIGQLEDKLMDTYSSKTFVAVVDGRIVGVGTVTKYPTYNQVQALHILPEYQGGGVGSELYKEAEIFLDISKPTIVEVPEYIRGSISFFETMGFVATGKKLEQEKMRMSVSGVVIPEVEMKKG